MFIYLSKKIAIPHEISLRSLAWNHQEGWIACGGDDGLLKVIKLESQTGSDSRARGVAAPSNLSMNENLEGHEGSVVCATWNHRHRRLTTADENGMIIVWCLNKNSWFEDMINDRKVSHVTDMKWTPDGKKICIAYADGAVIVGSLEGSRLWGSELNMSLTMVEWSPDARSILFANSDSEVYLYGAEGNKICQLELFNSGGRRDDKMIGMHWYDGARGYADVGAPTLAIAFESGQVQITRGVSKENRVLIDAEMVLSHCQWSSNGTILTLAGTPKRSPTEENSKKPFSMVQFYTAYGQHLRTLKVPGKQISAITWEGNGLRVALVVDSFIYFANIRPDYKWGYFSNTLCYAYSVPDRLENTVVFWDTNTNSRHTKYVKQLMAIRAAGENCVLATKAENISINLARAQRSVTKSSMSNLNTPNNEGKMDENGNVIPSDVNASFLLLLCNAIGSPIETKCIKVEPLFVAMTNHYVVAANEQLVYIWQYRVPESKKGSSGHTSNYNVHSDKSSNDKDLSKNIATIRRKEGREKMFHIDEDPTIRCINPNGNNSKELVELLLRPSDDSITCIATSDRFLIVGRESGLIHRYGLPHLTLEEKYVVKCRPQQIAINSNSTRFAIIDINAILTLFDMGKRTEGPNGQTQIGEHLTDFKRNDTWHMKWADDNPDLLAIMEKTRLYIFRGTEPEEPVQSSGYICQHSDLQIKAVLLDEIMQHPEAPVNDDVIDYETDTLRRAREIIDVGIEEGFAYIESRPHPRLWRLLAEAALERLEFAVADKAFVRCSDYGGIQFVKALRLLNDKVKQRAHVAAYFERFDEAEAYYRDIDRKDLAIELRKKLGDWLRVVQLVQNGADGGDDELLREARREIGKYYSSRQKWNKAVQYYALAKDAAALVQCYYILEEYEHLEKLVRIIPEGSPLLLDIGDKFHSVGMSEAACKAFIKGNDVKAAVDSCVLLNQWDHAVQLAQEHQFPQIEALLSKYALHLLEKGNTLQAIHLYRKAKKTTQAAALLSKLAKKFAKTDLLRAKKLYVLAALEVDEMRTRVLDTQMKTLQGGLTKKRFGFDEDEEKEREGAKPSMMTAAQTTAATLANLLQDDAATGEHRGLDNPWKGAEGVHLFMLAQRQLYSSRVFDSLVTAVKLREYEDIIDPRDIHSLIAVAAFYNQAWGQCSKAFSELETLKSISNQEKEAIAELAFSIFSKYPPVDPPKIENFCKRGDGICMASGKSISGKETDRIYKCRRCSRKMYEEQLRGLRHCPLCHMMLA